MAEKKKILYVENDKFFRQSVTHELRRSDYDVLSINTLTGIDEFLKEDLDLLILDGTIDSENDGWQLALKLHKAGQKVMVLSGNELPPNQDYWEIEFLSKSEAALFGIPRFIARFWR